MLNFLYNLATDKYNGFTVKILKFILFLFSLLYGLAIRSLSFFYRIHPERLDIKVISVGNITLGGTGKTPLVEYIARFLVKRGHKVAILSRGYKSKALSSQPSATSFKTIGDEPYMLTKKLTDIPIIVDSDRVRAANKAIKDYSLDTVILDDGLQQWRIVKDLEIVVIDAKNPFGNRHMIPRGVLREPLSSLRRSDIFMLSKANLAADTENVRKSLGLLNPNALVLESIHSVVDIYDLTDPGKSLSLDFLRNKTVTLFSGIGDPESFERLIRESGINVHSVFRFPDHHSYSEDEIKAIIQESQRKNTDAIITTEKDSVRLSQLLGLNFFLPVYILRIELKIKTEDEEKFSDRLLRLYSV